MAGAVTSRMSPIDAPSVLNGTSSEPRGTVTSPSIGSTTVPFDADDAHLGAVADADAVEVERVDVRRARLRQRGERR